ncbi:unnamed protein product [Cuscuta europaea]|uniref:Transmembrane and coiled-coil domain-containing protein 4 n=2 Tax=Cuscuta europaea TaxID=41803 RepID=A0A9P1DZ44_CUSEU|nr:unnamed protein product [Cuscuta europaea]
MPSPSILSLRQNYAAGGLFALAVHHVQIHQTRHLGSPSYHVHPKPAPERTPKETTHGCDSVSEDPQFWAHHSSGLLRRIFKFLEIEDSTWTGLEETAGSSTTQNHVEAFVRSLLNEEIGGGSSEAERKELDLAKAIDDMVSRLKQSLNYQSSMQKWSAYEKEYREKYSTTEKLEEDYDPSLTRHADMDPISGMGEKPAEDIKLLSYHRKLSVLYVLLSACLADTPEESTRQVKGYDARYRVALRLIATWFDVEWVKVEAIETMIACSAMAILKAEESEVRDISSDDTWAKWKRGGIIGAAALTGGTIMAITGGLAAPAIAAGVSALAPTLGTIVPVIGASGFAAVASAAGTVAGSVAVAASFGAAGAGLTGIKMARRIGDVDEFEFKEIGESQNQGRLAVEILISGFVFEEQDFLRPWEGPHGNLERYALQWESENLITLSTAIQDWLTSKIALGLMKQGAMMTVLSSLLSALALPATLFTMTELIDSKWAIAVNRSDKAGELMAEVLQKGYQGQRPVTLVGFSLGARVIFKCLQTLAADEGNAGLVERVVLLGAPIEISTVSWEAARKVVAGRFVNAYSTNDWMLGIVYRASLMSQGLAGIQPVEVDGIENVDVTELIEGHSAYLWTTQRILGLLDLAYNPVCGPATD